MGFMIRIPLTGVQLPALPSIRQLFGSAADEAALSPLEQRINAILGSIPVGWPSRLQEQGYQIFAADPDRDAAPGKIEEWMTKAGKLAVRLNRGQLTLDGIVQHIPTVPELRRWTLDQPKTMRIIREAHKDLGEILKKVKVSELKDYQLAALKVFHVQLAVVVGERHFTSNPVITRLDQDNPEHNSPEIMAALQDQERVHRLGVLKQGYASNPLADLRLRLGWEGPGAEYRNIYAHLDPLKPGILMSIQAVRFNRDDEQGYGNLPGNIDEILQGTNKVDGPVNAVGFYSISSGRIIDVSWSSTFIRNTAKQIHAENPDIVLFSTVSPMPNLRPWIEAIDHKVWERFGGSDAMGVTLPDLRHELRCVSSNQQLRENLALLDVMQRLSFIYLTSGKMENGRFKAVDFVAENAHLAGGAEIERINFAGSASDYMWKQSYGFMVNYNYPVIHNGAISTARLDENIRRFRAGSVPISSRIAPFVGGLAAKAPLTTNYCTPDRVPMLRAA